MSLTAAQRLLRPSSRYEVGGSARHAALGLGGASQRSESQRSSQDVGSASVRSSVHGGATGRPMLSFPSSNFASAEQAALAKRVTDQEARLHEQAATIRRLEGKVESNLEANSQLRTQIEQDLASVRGALPEMMRTLVSTLRQQMAEVARSQAEATRTMIEGELAKLTASIVSRNANEQQAFAASSPPATSPLRVPHTPSHAPTRRGSPPLDAPRLPSRHRSAVDASPPSEARPRSSKRSLLALCDAEGPDCEAQRARHHGDDCTSDGGDECDEGDEESFDLFADDDYDAGDLEAAPPPARPPSTLPLTGSLAPDALSPPGCASTPSDRSSHYTPLSLDPPSRRSAWSPREPPRRPSGLCASSLESRFDDQLVGAGACTKRAVGPIAEERRDCRLGEPVRRRVLRAMAQHEDEDEP